MRIRRDDGHGWVTDEVGTGPTVSQLPPDVRLPYRSGGLSQYTGQRFAALDKELCHIDTRPSEIGQMPEADVYDRSRHGGLNHVWNSQPHVTTLRYRPASGVLDQHPWIADANERDGFRRVDIGAITLPHDCANHLPEA